MQSLRIGIMAGWVLFAGIQPGLGAGSGPDRPQWHTSIYPSERAAEHARDSKREAHSVASFQEFEASVLTGTNEERPQVSISRGMILAWLPDPATDRPGNPGNYFLSADHTHIAVRPGTAMIIFPPRLTSASRQSYPGRFEGTQYQLAVTADGFWGIVDTTQRGSFLNEADLFRIADTEPADNSDSQYGIIVDTFATIPSIPALGLTRREMFRIVGRDANSVIIDFNSDIANIKQKNDDLAKAMATDAAGVPAEIRLDETKVKFVDIRVRGNLISEDQFTDWRDKHGDYQKIFRTAFSSLRMPDQVAIRQGCGQETTVSSRSVTEAGLGGDVSISPAARFLAWLSAKVQLSASGQASLAQSVEQVLTTRTATRQTLYLVEYREREAPETVFWAGSARTCANPVWSTMMVRSGDDERYLHASFYNLTTPEATAPPVTDDPVEQRMRSDIPGGSGWNATSATFGVRCFSQDLALADLAYDTMHNQQTPLYKIQAALALSSNLRLFSASSATLTTATIGGFIGSDAACRR